MPLNQHLYNTFELDFSSHAPELSGIDTVDMIFSANPGLTPAPLRLIASSGEIARVMLALKAVLADADAVPVLIFDEIDANIGGETASKVGDEIVALAGNKQILCISHLPQIASRAMTHFNVSKETVENTTFTHIRKLDSKGRSNEIARMLGGGKDALTLAEKMLKE